ncbi:ATP-binding cassette domain-containing protein [Corynebacterium kutscheri]|uniref:ATP-binding cassette domain-containing protein n=1 Tax=Corynebacterium kutscheri TaxID=35755 RepID=UPI00130D979E|nr:ABC transporter ATP-binding protein [Corynebacterium kutscheri]
MSGVVLTTKISEAVAFDSGLKKYYSMLRLRMDMVSFFFRYLPKREGFILTIANLMNLSTAFFPSMVAIAVTGKIGNSDVPRWSGLLFFFLVTTINQFLRPTAGSAQLSVATHLAFIANKKIARALSNIETLEGLEDSEFKENLSVLRSRDTVLGESLLRTYQAIFNLCLPLFLMIVAILTAPVILWMFPVCILVIWVGVLAEKIRAGADKITAAHQLEMHNFCSAARGNSMSTELQIYGASRWYINKFSNVERQRTQPAIQANLHVTWLYAASSAVYFTVGALVVWKCSYEGDVHVVLVALLTIMQLSTLLSGIRFAFSDLAKAQREYSRFRKILAIKDYRNQTTNYLPRADTHKHWAVLTNVSYKYPGADTFALQDVSIVLPQNSLISIVGGNGSGKTTLAMLLRGVRSPTTGEIQRKDSSVRTNAAGKTTINVTGVPQRPAHWELIAIEAATFPQKGSYGRFNNEAFSLSASGAEEVFDNLDHGEHTPLGQSWQHPTQLSGGQWQRIGNARGLLGADQSTLIIIDEPTSSLDALAEAKMVATCRRMVEESSIGASVVLVTHRISSALASDFVIMLDKAQVVAQGSPETLLKESNALSALVNEHKKAR